MNKSIYPKARNNGLVTSKVGDETVVYDTETDRASCLNEITTIVWGACDGKTDTTSILETIKSTRYQDANTQVILLAIDQLDKAGLLEKSLENNEKKRESLNRREMLRWFSTKSAALLPVVTMIDIQPAMAQISRCLDAFHAPCSPSSLPCCPPKFCKNGKCKLN